MRKTDLALAVEKAVNEALRASPRPRPVGVVFEVWQTKRGLFLTKNPLDDIIAKPARDVGVVSDP